MPDNFRLSAEAVFDLADEVEQRDWRFTSAEVDDFVSGDDSAPHGPRGEDGTAGDVVDVGEVAGLRSVAEDGDGGPFVDPLDEAEGGHVGASSRAVDGEVAQDGNVEAVEVMVGVGENLGGFLRSGVGGEGPVDGEILAEGHGVPGVEGRGRGEDKLAAAALLHQLEDVERALGIRLHVDVRILDAVAHSGTGGEIEDDVEFTALEDAIEVIEILDVAFVESEAFAVGEVGKAVLFDAEIVGVVEIIDPDDLDSLFKKEAGDAVGDKSGGAGDENSFHAG